MADTAVDSFTPQYTEIDGLRIRYATSTTAAGPPVLLTSPWPQSLFAFHAIWSTLAEAAPLVAVDLPGFGRSDVRPDLLTPPALGAFVLEIVEHFSLDRPHVVAPDIGTSALLYAATTSPDAFTSLVVGSGAIDERLTAGALKDMIDAPTTEAFEAADGADVVSQIIDALMQTPPTAERMQDYRDSYAGRRFVDSMAYVRDYPRSLPPLRKLLPTIPTPVQIIYGHLDPAVPPSNAELLHRLLPHSASLGLDCGHFTWEDAPAEYSQAVRAWIDGGFEDVNQRSPAAR